jgi:hypothetical protein
MQWKTSNVPYFLFMGGVEFYVLEHGGRASCNKLKVETILIASESYAVWLL